MLQQTRVAAVIPYYERFIKEVPTVKVLAALPETKLLSLWAGLGYYSRARNLQKAAKQIVERKEFPKTYDSLRELAGIGDYTAAAIASIAFQKPHVVIDGNVLRVMSRLTADPGDIKATVTKERLRKAAAELLPTKQPGDFNQALMELGATICIPKEPQCGKCPISKDCQALSQGKQRELPIKSSPREPIAIEQTLLWIERNGKILVTPSKKVKGFWDLPEEHEAPHATKGRNLGHFKHSITHHRYHFKILKASIRRPAKPLVWMDPTLHPLSTIARKAVQIAAGK